MATIDVKDANGNTVSLQAPPDPGRAAASASRPVALSTEDKAALDALATQVTVAAILAKILAAPATEAKQDAGNTSLASIDTKMTTLAGHVDGLEALASALNGYVDGLEALVTSGNATATSIAGYVDGLEALATTLNGLLTTQAGYLDGLETLIVATNAALAAAIPAGTNVIGKVDHTSTGIGHGVTTVTTAGTDVALAGSTPAKWVSIQAQTDNTGLIAVGATGVDATVATGNGVALSAGQVFSVPIDNLADVFIDATVSGDGVRYTYGT